MLFLDFLGIGDAIGKAISWITLWIVSGVYNVAAFGFKVFLILAEGRLVGSDDYSVLVQNIYAILGVVMLFIVAFMLLKLMINPEEKQGTSAIKKIIINLITSILGISLLTPIFDFAYDFQFSILENNVIGKVLGFTSTSSNSGNIHSGAFQIVNGVYTAFFSPYCKDATTNEKLKNCYQETELAGGKTYDGYIFDAEVHGDFAQYANASDSVYEGDIDFNFLMSLIGGLLLVYISVSYCLDMGFRLIKLAFYQVIAPIPILLRIIPDGKLSGTFKNWLKVTSTCFLEVFIRILALYFCVFLCGVVANSDFLEGILADQNAGILTYLFVKAFVFMGLITFMRQAPKLISEVTGLDSSNMSLGIKDKLAAGGAFTAGAILGGAVTGLGRNAVNAAPQMKESAIATANKFKNIKGEKGFKNKARAFGSALKSSSGMIRGAGSIVAGTASGGFNAGRSGVNAKSVSDVKSATIKGGAAVDKNRADRADRNKRYQATGGNWFTRSAVGGRMMDTLQGAGDYFSGGADKYSGIIKTADEMTGAYDSMETQAKKIMEKFYNDGDIVARPTSADDFKGENAAELFDLYSKYGNDASLSLIQSDLKKMESIDPSTLVNMVNYKRKNGKVDMFAYNQAVEKARIDHAKKVANTREMLTQLEKKSVENIIQNAIVHGNAGEDWTSSIKQSDLMGVLSAAREFESTFKSNGNNVVDPISGATYNQSINLEDPNVQEYMDKIQKAYKNIGNQAKQQSADMRRKAAQRKNE